MPATAIVTDSTSDIPVEEAEALGIEVVPALVTVEGQSYLDGSGLSRPEFYRRLPFLREPATTAAPSPQVFEMAYDKVMAAGAERVLSMHVSSKLSGLIDVARIAAASFGDRVHVFDSLQVSLALGFQAMEAAAAALAGATFDAILQVAQRARDRVRIVAMIDTLEYLRKGGRLSPARAAIGTVLSVKPIITVRDGSVTMAESPRTRAKSRERVAQLITEKPIERLAVIHTPTSPREEVEAFRDMLVARIPGGVDPAHVSIGLLGASTGPHLGPGLLGASFLRRR
jgi:DegV family protein with EDD domain